VIRPPPGRSDHAVWISRGVQNSGIQASDSLDGYVANGRLSLTSLVKPIARRPLYSERKMRIQMTIIPSHIFPCEELRNTPTCKSVVTIIMLVEYIYLASIHDSRYLGTSPLLEGIISHYCVVKLEDEQKLLDGHSKLHCSCTEELWSNPKPQFLF
jgi:hypothetical protein